MKVYVIIRKIKYGLDFYKTLLMAPSQEEAIKMWCSRYYDKEQIDSITEITFPTILMTEPYRY